jgi:MFS transporter, PAT family, beta-lactamase induction signal transducer AmpG
MNNSEKKKRNPWLYISTQYFAEGVPFVIVNQLSVAMYKSLDASNVFIGITSLLYLPWSIKFLWSPLVDGKSTKRSWVLAMQILLAICFLGVSAAMNLQGNILISLIFFIIIAFLSSTHDIATDGFYLHALNTGEQAFFSGIRSSFYRLAMIFSGGFLVYLADVAGKYFGKIEHGWSLSLGVAGIVFLFIYFYHIFILPRPVTDKAVISEKSSIPFKEAFSTYFKQEKIGFIIGFILLVRFGEAMLLKMLQPFLMDKIEKGGMAISLSEVGIMYGIFGILALIIGGILSGWIIKKYGLKRTIWLLIIFMHIPNIFYIYLAYFRPDNLLNIDLSFILHILGNNNNWILSIHPIVQLIIIVEQFSYGLGFTAFMVFLLYLSKGEFKTSHYAISTGIMAIGMMLPGFISGFVQEAVGYPGLFIISTFGTIPGLIFLFFIPIKDSTD